MKTSNLIFRILSWLTFLSTTLIVILTLSDKSLEIIQKTVIATGIISVLWIGAMVHSVNKSN